MSWSRSWIQQYNYSERWDPSLIPRMHPCQQDIQRNRPRCRDFWRGPTFLPLSSRWAARARNNRTLEGLARLWRELNRKNVVFTYDLLDVGLLANGIHPSVGRSLRVNLRSYSQCGCKNERIFEWPFRILFFSLRCPKTLVTSVAFAIKSRHWIEGSPKIWRHANFLHSGCSPFLAGVRGRYIQNLVCSNNLTTNV